MLTHALTIAIALGAADTDWPHLRGPGHDGHVASSVFQEGEFALEVAWKRGLGSGYSGIVVSDGILVTMFQDGPSDFVVALDGASGDERWRQEIGAAYFGHDGSEDGPISTPLVHRGVVYALGPRGRFVAVALESGAALWSHDLVADFGAKAPDYGFTTTPIAAGDLVILQIGGGEQGHAIGGFDARTGALRWSAGEQGAEYQSPMVMTLAGRSQLVVVRGNVLAGHDPATGAVLWEHELGRRDGTGNGIPAPVDENHFLLVGGSGLMVFAIEAVDGGYEIKTEMKSRDIGRAYAPPVRFGGHYYGFRSDFLTCVDATSGKRMWKSRPPGGKGLILVNDRLVVFGAEGRVVVVAATPEGYREEASLGVFDDSGFTWPSFANDLIYLRNPREVAALRVVSAGGGRGGIGVASGARAESAAGDTPFGRFLRELDDAPDKSARVDDFFADYEEWPIVEDDLVHFVYRGDVEDVAIADLFYRTYRVQPGARLEYQFQVDLERWETDPRNPHDVPGERGDQRLSEVALSGYERPSHIGVSESRPRGRLDTFSFVAEPGGSERKITVYLPHAYDPEPDRAFPLLLVQEGSAWIEKGLLVNTLDSLIGETVAPVVVAFVDTIGMWWLEAGGSNTDAYVDMLAEQLVPDLSRRYRIQPVPSARAIMGARDFGLAAAYAAFKYPGVFGNVAIQSVGLRNGAGPALFELVGRRPIAPIALYVDWNLYEQRSIDRGIDFETDSRTLVGALERRGYAYAGGEAIDCHGWGSWRARTDRILETFFPLDGATR